MSTPYQQDTRIGELTTPLGPGKLVLVTFDGAEAISELFQFTISALCEQEAHEELDFDVALGKTCTIRVPTYDQGDRYFAGTLTEARRIGPVDGGVLYDLVLRPWFWLLSRRVNSRIFHEKPVDEIIRIVLGEHGYADFENKTDRSYKPMEYCVQHRESDLAFLCRLMEQHGIGYHFEYADDKQTLILTASRSGYKDAPGKTRNFYANPEGNPAREEYLHQWIAQRRFNTGKVTLNDYNFKEPDANLIVEKPGGAGYQPADLEHYDHPGKYVQQSAGDPLATAAIDAIQATDGHYFAEGNCLSLSPGYVFNLATHHDAGEYLVVRATHRISRELYRSGADGGGGEPYYGSYELMRADRQYAPPLITPRPHIAGPQTAKVVGESELETDKYGRIKVHFHWNRANEGDPEYETMWCRVAQIWAGAEWGGQFLPRKDMEVLVQFIDGDPDRPIIVGSVYNEKNKPPYELPHDKDTSGWKTKTMEGEGYNEIAFVDTSGSELIRIYGERDLTATLRNDVLIEAEHQITLKVGTSTIVMDTRSIKLKAESIEIEANMDLKTNGKVMANHESGGVMIIKAAIVKIN
jgi:type VI secretion system secreted protein VgrG